MDDGYVLARRLRGTLRQAPDTLPPPAEWMRDVPCRGLSALFHSDTSGLPGAHLDRRAKAICRPCPHRAECLALAMNAERGRSSYYRYGIFAGLDGVERRELGRAGWRPGDPLPPVRIEGRESA